MENSQLYIQKNLSELDVTDQQLISKAKEASTLSYAPYSKFHVGAALLLDNGEIVLGANQENASYSLSICAERSGLFNAAINQPGQIIKKIRIHNAEALIAKNQYSIKEVQYMTGFNNPKSFRDAFVEEYGVLPSEYTV